MLVPERRPNNYWAEGEGLPMFQKGVKLSAHSNYKIGGHASYFFEAEGVSDIIEALAHWRKISGGKKSDKVFILGGGTNLLINDAGFHGLVIKPVIKNIAREGNVVRAGAGVLMSDLLEFAASEGLSGLEWAGGLPGTLGGAIRGNAGAFGGEIKDSIISVVSLDISGEQIIRRSREECDFNYRDSVFKKKNGSEVIIEAVINLSPGDKSAIKNKIDEKIHFRHTRHPMDYPNIGSIFKNVDYRKFKRLWQRDLAKIVKTDPFPVVPTAYLLSECGLKGVSLGGAMISPKHPNFIVNVLTATSLDVQKLISLAKAEVENKFGIQLEEEIIYL